jgi:hypothetical protein
MPRRIPEHPGGEPTHEKPETQKEILEKKICMCLSCARLLTPLIASDPCRKKDSSIVPDIGHPAQLHRQGDPQRLLLQNRFPGEKICFFFITGINF